MKKSKPEFGSLQEIRDRLQIYGALMIFNNNECVHDPPYQKNRI